MLHNGVHRNGMTEYYKYIFYWSLHIASRQEMNLLRDIVKAKSFWYLVMMSDHKVNLVGKFQKFSWTML